MPAKTKSACGINHVWNVTSVVQEGSCDKEGIYKVQCVNCGATGTVTTDAPGHNYVNGACTDCGELQGVEVAPEAELAKWTYELNETNGTIVLKNYVSNEPEVVVYGSYKVNGKIYKSILNASYFGEKPFWEKRKVLTSLVIKKGVESTSCDTLFRGCENLTLLDISNLDTSEVTNMEYMFEDCKSLTMLDVSNLDTSKVTSMYQMFWNCENLTELNVSNFNTSNVTNMVSMFGGCIKITNLDLSNFDTS